MSILHPWPHATGKYASRGHIMGASGDMFGPWAAYFTVSLCQGCNVIPIIDGVRELGFLCFKMTEKVPLLQPLRPEYALP